MTIGTFVPDMSHDQVSLLITYNTNYKNETTFFFNSLIAQYQYFLFVIPLQLIKLNLCSRFCHFKQQVVKASRPVVSAVQQNSIHLFENNFRN